MKKSINQRVSKIAIAVFIGGLSLTQPAYAHNNASGSMSRVEQRIQTMHDKLNLTPAQEPQWKDVAKIMRENETDIHKRVEDRHENEPANAVEDLHSYEAIADAHAEGLKKLVPAFETLYDNLSAAQKISADKMFGRFEGRSAPKALSARSHNNQE